ncbi:MAG: glycosyl hydrolase family 43 [Acidimicrobiales bacterium]|nr:glycosyl hydrolase family 43 [Acidimicrobiales bacterium]
MPVRFRRRSLLAVAAVVAVTSMLVGCGPTLGKPAVRQAPVAPRVFDNSDPFVLNVDGDLYLFGSSNNKRVPVRRINSFNQTLSQSQSHWASVAGSPTTNNAMTVPPAWIDPGESDIWAPTVAKMGTKYVMFFAGHRSGAIDEGNDLCIGRATASGPAGPYAPESTPAYCGLAKVDPGANPWGHGALDPEIFRAPDGKFYLLAALSRTKNNIGVVGLTGTGGVVGGVNARPTTLASLSTAVPWHDGTDNSSFTGSSFLENPSMIYEPLSKTYLLFYSAGQWDSSRYLTGFGRCTTPVGPCVIDTRGPFLKGAGTRSGTGGLTAFKDGSGRMVVAYASWTTGHEAPFGPGQNPEGIYSRQVSWELLAVNGSNPATQTITLQ